MIRTGEPELVPEITEDMLTMVARDDLHLELLQELGLSSYMCVPIKGRESVLGAITLITSDSGRHFGAEDLSLAEELARRAATAIENARLYREAEARAQAARVLATIGDGVFLVDRTGRIRLWNSAAQWITGLQEADVLGRAAATTIPGWDTISLESRSRAPARARARRAFRFNSTNASSGCRCPPLGFEDGTVYAFRDLTEERALESMRQDLVATVSHELRTPLAAIYGAALTLRRDDVDLEEELHNKLLDVIAEESDRLADIVNDLLLASQLDSGRLKANIERCDPREIVQLEIDAVRIHLPEHVKLHLAAPDELPACRSHRVSCGK